MPWHLRPLEKCTTCGRPATERLFNAVNAPGLAYCSRHAARALRIAQEKIEQPPPT